MNVLQLFLLILALVLFVVATFIGQAASRFNLVAGGLAALTGAFLVGELG